MDAIDQISETVTELAALLPRLLAFDGGEATWDALIDAQIAADSLCGALTRLAAADLSRTRLSVDRIRGLTDDSDIPSLSGRQAQRALKILAGV